MDNELMVDNFVSRRGKSAAGGMPSFALLSKFEQTGGIYEDPRQLRNYHRQELRDFTCEKPWLESDMPFNGGIDPRTGQSRAGGSHSRSVLNRHFGGARNNTDPYLPNGTFLDWEFLGNRDEYVDNGKKHDKNYTAGQQGIARTGGDVNWDEARRQNKYRMKYVKFFSDADYSTVEHGVNPVKMSEDIHKARFEGLKKFKVFRKSKEGRKPGSNPVFTRGGEKDYHNIDQTFREENVQTNQRQWLPEDKNVQDYVDQDHEAGFSQLGRDNPSFTPLSDREAALYQAVQSQKIAQAFKDIGVQKSLAIVINTLNNASSSQTTQRETEGFTMNARKLGVTELGVTGMLGQQAIESRAYEIARALQVDINNRKIAQPFENKGRIGNTYIDTAIHEYLGLANRKLGPQEITLNLKEASLNTGLQPGADVMDFANTTKRSLAIDVLDLPRSKLNSKLAHYRDDSRATMNFSNITPQTRNSLPLAFGESYGDNSRENIQFKSAQNLYDGLKAAYTREDMTFSEGMVDNQSRSTARGKGNARRLAIAAHKDKKDEDDGSLNELGPSVIIHN